MTFSMYEIKLQKQSINVALRRKKVSKMTLFYMNVCSPKMR